jgi:cytochrome c biogenesis protein
MPVAKKPVAGYSFQLVDYEKVADRHVLAVQRDPGSNVVYVGFLMLVITLIAVFFFSHQRVWAAVERAPDGTLKTTLAGNTNRNGNAFNEKFARFVNSLQKQHSTGETL